MLPARGVVALVLASAAAIADLPAIAAEEECQVDLLPLVRGARALDVGTLRARASEIGASFEARDRLAALLLDPDADFALRLDALRLLAAMQHVEIKGYPPASWSRRTLPQGLAWIIVDTIPRGLEDSATSPRDARRAMSARFLAAALAEPDPDVRAVAASLAARSEVDSARLRRALREAAREEPPEVHVRAAAALQRRDERLDPATRSALLNDLSRSEGWIRSAASRVLHAEAPHDPRLAAVLEHPPGRR